MSPPVEVARATLRANAAVLRALESHVEARFAAHDDASAIGWAQIAADFAWRNHPGRFASPRIERVLAAIGSSLAPVHAARPRAVHRVLHVLTEGYETGGHTRLAWRWMQRDAGRRHAVALTNPGKAVPRALRDAAEAVHELPGLDLLTRAAELRALAADFDLVALHVHMHDAVPCLAFAGRTAGPPVVFVDHADHLFWLGVGVADVVTACRAPAGTLQVARRGIDAERSVLLPVPTDAGRRATPAAEAKAALELDPAARVLLTVAVAHKFAPVVTPSFFDAVGAALAAHDDVVLVAVGPTPDDPGWPALREAYPGRVRAVGSQRDLQPYWDAADAYVDSYPFSSNTSAIEAAGHGLPVISFAPDPEQQGLLLTHDPGFEDALVRASDPASYADAVGAVLADPAPRGAALQAGVAAAHTGDGWQAHLEDVYARALDVAPVAVPVDPNAPERVADWEAVHHLLFAAIGTTAPLARSVFEQLPALPPDERPADEASLHALCRWDGLAAVAPDTAAVDDAVEHLRVLHAAGMLGRCVVTVAPDALDDTVPLLERALQAGTDFPLDVVATHDPTAAAAGGRVLLLT